MRVLIDAHAAIQKKTGIGRYVQNLIDHLVKEKVNLSLYTHSPVTKTLKKYPQYKAPMKNGFFRVFWGLNKATSLLNPDILHISNFAPIIKTAPIVMTVHDLCFKTHTDKYPLKTNLAFKLFFEMSLKMSDAIICVSECTKKELLRLYDIDKKKVRVIYEAPDPIFKPTSKKKAKMAVKKFGIKKDFLLVVGNIEPRKNPGLIVDAFNKFAEKNQDFELVFVGPDLVKEKTRERVKNLGFVDDGDLNYLYNASSALIYYSECEGFGLPLVEAMATKTPVICSDLEVFKEVAKDAALFVKNKKELTKAMNKIVNDKSLRDELVKEGFKKQKAYGWKKTARETLEVYKKLA
mgnify:CR=1 FL=1